MCLPTWAFNKNVVLNLFLSRCLHFGHQFIYELAGMRIYKSLFEAIYQRFVVGEHYATFNEMIVSAPSLQSEHNSRVFLTC